jgi:hypothetical protein
MPTKSPHVTREQLDAAYAEYFARGKTIRTISRGVRGYTQAEIRALEYGNKTLAEIHAARPDPDALA